MKILLIILFAVLNTYVFSESPVENALKIITERFNPNSEGLDFQIQFTMRAKGIIKGDLSYCLASLVNIKRIKYLVTSTGCLVRKGAKIQSNTYYATEYKIIYKNYNISGPISFNHNNIPENSILLIKLPPNYQANTINMPTNSLLFAQYKNYSILNNEYNEIVKSLIPTEVENDSFFKVLFSQYYSRNTDQVLKISPVLISIPNRVGKYYNLSTQFYIYSYEKDSSDYYNGMQPSSDLYIKDSQGVHLNKATEIFDFNNNSVIKSLGASLTLCDLKYRKCYLIGILTGNKTTYPYFSFLSAKTIYLLNNSTKTLIKTDLLSIN